MNHKRIPVVTAQRDVYLYRCINIAGSWRCFRKLNEKVIEYVSENTIIGYIKREEEELWIREVYVP